jgi:hypothetical protein
MNAKLELMQDDCLKSYTLGLLNERSSEKTNYKQSLSCDSSTSGIVATTESSAVASSASSSASSVNGSPQIYTTFVNKLTTIHSQNNGQPNQTKTNTTAIPISPISKNSQDNQQKKKKMKKNPSRRHTIAMSIAEFKPIHQLSEQIKSISKSSAKKRSKSNSKVVEEENANKILSKSIANLPSLNKNKLAPNEEVSCASNEIDESQVKSAILNLSPLSISTSSVSSISSSSMSTSNKQFNKKQAFNVATNLSNQVGSISNAAVSNINENRHENNSHSIKHDQNSNSTMVQFNCTFESLI